MKHWFMRAQLFKSYKMTPLWISSEYIKISLYGIYGYTVYIRSYTAYIRYMEIPYTVWANPKDIKVK